MSTASRALLAALTIGAAHPALAQTEEDLTLTLSGGDFTGELRYVSIDTCASQAAANFTLTGTLANAPDGDYEMRLTFTDRTAVCDRDTFGEQCDDTAYPVGDETCVCIRQVDSSTSVTQETSLDRLLPTLCDDVEANPREFRGRFYLQYHGSGQGDDAEVDQESTPIEVNFDFQRPPPPAAVPRVTAVEEGLEVSFDQVAGADVAEYEVCRRLESDAGGAAAGSTGNTALRQGYSGCKTSSGGSVRLTGMQNGVAYRVVYATKDNAGNRSENSPSVTGTPQASFDFAEWYHSRNGPATGGCSATPTTFGGGALVFGLALLGLMRRFS